MDESTARSRHPDSIGQAFLWALLPTLVLVLNAPNASYAQVATNISPSALPACPGPCGPGITIVTLPPPGTTVTTITGGARPGNGPNLFHSFGRFDVGTGDIANFFNETGLKTDNILSRVTGGNPSQIYGTIRTTDFGSANIFLMNPAGVLFGPTAVLDLGAVSGSAARDPGGSFYATTADYLKLGDTSLFYANDFPAKVSVLSVAPVAAFGFTASNPVAITIEGSVLMVGQGQTLSIIGGNTPFNKTIQEDPLLEQPVPSGVTVTGGVLLAPGGQIQVVSVASPGEVLVSSLQTGLNINPKAPFTTMGTVTLESAYLDVSGQVDEFGTPIGNGSSGTVFVRGGQLVMDVSEIHANTVGPVPVDVAHTAVDIQVSQDVTLNNGSLIKTLTSGPGRGGDVHITAHSLTLENGSFIITENSELGLVGGDISLNVGELHLLGNPSGDPLFGSQILSINSTGTDLDGNAVTGVGGKITVQGIEGAGSVADKVEISGGSGIVSETQNTSGDGGRISITANSLDLLGEASIIKSITSVTGTDLNGDGVVDAGRGGDIVMAVQHLSVVDGAAISSNTISESAGAADGGMITVQGLEGGPGSKTSSVLLSGPNTGIASDSALGVPGNLTVNAGTLTITKGAVISTGTALSGPTGTVTVTADSIVISADGKILSQSFNQDAGKVTITANNALTLDNGSIKTSTSGSGRGGDVKLNGGTVSLTNGARINSQSEIFSTGQAGTITITGKSLTLANHSEITSSSKGTVADAGDAGNVTITSSGAFTSDASTIATSAENARGGNIDLTAQSVALSNGAVMSASSRSPLLPDGGGNAGNITIQSGSKVVMNNSSMTTEASQASGGRIEITAPEMVQLINSRVSTTVAGSATDTAGGDITIDPQFVVLQNSQIIARANAGSGGAIDITAGVFLADPASIVDASSTLGISGTVNIQSPVQNIGGRLTPLSQQFSSAAALLAQRCAARAADGKFSTFVVAGREGLPVEPGGFLASPSLTAELLGSSLAGRYPHTAIAAVTGLFPEYDARPIQLAKYGDACHQ